MSTPVTPVRELVVTAGSTDVFGRVVLNAREHSLVVDGPIQNGCLGEAIGPAELFLGGVASCGAELVEVIAREEQIPLRRVGVTIFGRRDPDNPVRQDVALFNTVSIRFELEGVDDQQAAVLVGGFKRRCPLYGTVAVATPDVQVEWTNTP